MLKRTKQFAIDCGHLIVEFNKDKREKTAILHNGGEEVLKMIVASLKDT